MLGTTHADTFNGPIPCTRDLTAEECAKDYEYNTGRVMVDMLDEDDRSAVEVPRRARRQPRPVHLGRDAPASPSNTRSSARPSPTWRCTPSPCPRGPAAPASPEPPLHPQARPGRLLRQPRARTGCLTVRPWHQAMWHHLRQHPVDIPSPASSMRGAASERIPESQGEYRADLEWTELDRRAVDTVRVLAMDAVQKVGNGHPGTAMSLAPAAYLLFQKVMRHDPADPHWPGRDRFVLSPAHTSGPLLRVSGEGRVQGAAEGRVRGRRGSVRLRRAWARSTRSKTMVGPAPQPARRTAATP